MKYTKVELMKKTSYFFKNRQELCMKLKLYMLQIVVILYLQLQFDFFDQFMFFFDENVQSYEYFAQSLTGS